MGMYTWLLLGLALGIASPYMIIGIQRRRDLVRAGDGPAPVSRAEVMRPSNPFAAVSIRPGLERPCAAVIRMQSERFLAVRAPPLPVPGCDSKKCTCRYIRHTDRRAPGDRRDGFARFGGLIPKAGDDRRKADRRKKS